MKKSVFLSVVLGIVFFPATIFLMEDRFEFLLNERFNNSGSNEAFIKDCCKKYDLLGLKEIFRIRKSVGDIGCCDLVRDLAERDCKEMILCLLKNHKKIEFQGDACKELFSSVLLWAYSKRFEDVFSTCLDTYLDNGENFSLAKILFVYVLALQSDFQKWNDSSSISKICDHLACRLAKILDFEDDDGKKAIRSTISSYLPILSKPPKSGIKEKIFRKAVYIGDVDIIKGFCKVEPWRQDEISVDEFVYGFFLIQKRDDSSSIEIKKEIINYLQNALKVKVDEFLKKEK